MRDHVKIGFSAMFGPSHTDIKGMTKEQIRDIYESELTKMRAERDELVGGMELIASAKDRGFGIDYARGMAESLLSKYTTE